MWTSLSWILAGSLLLGLVFLFLMGPALWRGIFELKANADAVLSAYTEDLWVLPLWRFDPPKEVGRRWEQPVVLCHGLQANRFNMDFTPKRSLALALAARGFRVYVVELRGSGEARYEPGLSEEEGAPPQPIGFDAHLSQDLPAILATVRQQEQGAKVLWAGHSMGGMLAYAMSDTPLEDSLAGVVAIASPASFAWHPKRVRRLPGLALKFFPRGLRVRWVLQRLTPFAGYLGAWPAGDSINHHNIEGWAIRRIVFNLIGDLSQGHLEAFARFLLEDQFCAADGSDFREAMGRGKVPALLLAGAADRLAPPRSVEAAFEAMGGRARYQLIGKSEGFEADYGHGDILLGRTAPKEVYPLIGAWLEGKASSLEP